MPRQAVSSALMVALSVVCLVPVVVSLGTDGWWEVPGAVASVSLLVAGMLLWRPGTRSEALMLVLAGDSFALSGLNSRVFEQMGGWWEQVGWTVQWIPVPLVAAVLLSHPHGRLELRRHRVLIGLTWVWAVGFQLASSLLWDPRFGGYTGPAQWYHVYASRRAVDLLAYASLISLVPLVGWFVREFVLRWRTARGLVRTPTRWVAAAGVVLALGLLARNALPVAVDHRWVSGAVRTVVDQGHQVLVAAAVTILVGIGIRGSIRTGAVAQRLLRAGGDPGTVQDILREELRDPR